MLEGSRDLEGHAIAFYFDRLFGRVGICVY